MGLGRYTGPAGQTAVVLQYATVGSMKGEKITRRRDLVQSTERPRGAMSQQELPAIRETLREEKSHQPGNSLALI